MKKFLLLFTCIVSLVGSYCYTYAQIENQDPNVEAILSYTSDIRVQKDNSIDVTETLVYNTGSSPRHGIYRDIDIFSAQNRTMDIENITITDENNIPYLFELTNSAGAIHVRIGDPDVIFTGIKTYVINYHATNAISQLEDRDEIYWNVTGNGWQIPLYKIRATIMLPAGAKFIQASCYYGTRGSTNGCNSYHNTSIDYKDFTFESPVSLYPGRELTVAVGFQKGIVSHYEDVRGLLFRFFSTCPDWVIASILPLLTLIISLMVWYRRGRDPRGSGVIVPQYDIPEGLTPMEVAGIVYEKVKPKHISAEILYLATRGYLTIRQLEKSSRGFMRTNDYELTRRKDSLDLPNDFDRKLLDGLFNKQPRVNLSIRQALFEREPAPEVSGFINNHYVKLSDLHYRFYQDTVIIIKSVLSTLLDKGYYKNLGRMKTRGNKILLIFTAAILNFIFLESIFGQFLSDDHILDLIIGIFSSAIIYGIASRFSPAKTEKGVAIKEYLLGLRDYLQIAEKDRLIFHNAPDKNPETFEKLLPYAMVFGVADIWAKEFEGIYTTSPSWYIGHEGTTFSPISFTHSIADFSTYAGKTFRSSPSGGSSGGGSAGGGGGGGGGGGW